MRESGSPPYEQTELFGGLGTVAVWDLLAGLEAPPFSAVLSCELAPKGIVGKHVQQRDPEILVGLGGEGVAEVNDEARTLSPGSVVYLAHGQTLSIHNLSASEPLRYLIIKGQVRPSE